MGFAFFFFIEVLFSALEARTDILARVVSPEVLSLEVEEVFPFCIGWAFALELDNDDSEFELESDDEKDNASEDLIEATSEVVTEVVSEDSIEAVSEDSIEATSEVVTEDVPEDSIEAVSEDAVSEAVLDVVAEIKSENVPEIDLDAASPTESDNKIEDETEVESLKLVESTEWMILLILRELFHLASRINTGAHGI